MMTFTVRQGISASLQHRLRIGVSGPARNAERERASKTHLALNCQYAAMQLDEAARECKTQPCTLRRAAGGARGLLELFEDARLIFGWNADTSVANRDACATVNEAGIDI